MSVVCGYNAVISKSRTDLSIRVPPLPSQDVLVIDKPSKKNDLPEWPRIHFYAVAKGNGPTDSLNAYLAFEALPVIRAPPRAFPNNTVFLWRHFVRQV
jgi:hypothetical protein